LFLYRAFPALVSDVIVLEGETLAGKCAIRLVAGGGEGEEGTKIGPDEFDDIVAVDERTGDNIRSRDNISISLLILVPEVVPDEFSEKYALLEAPGPEPEPEACAF
jgi:hypothetical protein